MNTSLHPATGSSQTHADVAMSASPTYTGEAHGKVILVGEHSVVYGAPAIALPVFSTSVKASLTLTKTPAQIRCEVHDGDVRQAPYRLGPTITAWMQSAARWGLDPDLGTLDVDSTIPLGRGLGSSAAVAAAVVRAVAAAAGHDSVEPEVMHQLIQAAETVAHGTPSGLDARAVVADHPIRFQRGKVTTAALGGTFTFVVADSGVSGATSTAVSAVRALRDDHRDAVDRAIADLADITNAAEGSLTGGNTAALGEQMNLAHDALIELGVSGTALDRLAAAARSAGALGAKLTGGGLGGCVLALVAPGDEPAHLAAELRGAGAARVWTTSVGPAA